jgi:hypothetical protein
MKIASGCYIRRHPALFRLTSANAVILFNESRAGRATTYNDQQPHHVTGGVVAAKDHAALARNDFELPDFIVRSEVVDCNFPGSDESKRARRLREAMGFNGRGGQQAFANFLGVDRGRWNNVECGAPLSKDMALRIVRKFPGVTLDWLFLGRPEGLTVEMARMLLGSSKGNDANGDSTISSAF